MIVVFMQVFIGLFFALLLSYVTKGAGIFRTLYYLPAVVVTVAIAQMFRNFYSLQPLGLMNMFLDWVGMGHLQSAWLSNPHTALIAVSIPEGWRFIGMYMVIFYAALIAIPKEIEEAARIDGVNGWQLIRYIKLPSIMHVLSLALIMCTTGALRGFDIPYIIGVPGSATELVTTYMYKQAFSTIQYGYGSSIAVFIVIESLLAVLIIRAIFLIRRKEMPDMPARKKALLFTFVSSGDCDSFDSNLPGSVADAVQLQVEHRADDTAVCHAVVLVVRELCQCIPGEQSAPVYQEYRHCNLYLSGSNYCTQRDGRDLPLSK
ncbi:carbohydrate ABC transporter permease [Paenibacillus rhizoplanae]